MPSATPQPAPFRSYIEPNTDAEFPAEIGRYHLYMTYSCPFACRALSARNLKGLEDIVGLSVAHPVFQKTKPDDPSDSHLGWTFTDPAKMTTFVGADGIEYQTEGTIPDSVNGAIFVRDLYKLVDTIPRQYTLPLLWNKKKQTIVSNESADILRSFDTGFRELAPSNIELVPATLEKELHEANDGIVVEVDNHFFHSLLAKDEATKKATEEAEWTALHKLDDLLATKRYLVGDGITEADIRLFHTLIRLNVILTKENNENLTKRTNIVGVRCGFLERIVVG